MSKVCNGLGLCLVFSGKEAFYLSFFSVIEISAMSSKVFPFYADVGPS